MSVISSRRTQHDIACDMRLVSGSIRTVNHQVVISRSGISRYHNIMMMDMSRSLFRNIVRLIKGEINSRLSQVVSCRERPGYDQGAAGQRSWMWI